MPTVVPTGCLSLVLHNLRTLISQSAAFQAWVGAADAAAALPRIHLVGVALPAPTPPATDPGPTEYAATRPNAVINFEPRDGFLGQRTAESAYEDSGYLMVLFQDNVDLSFTTYANAVYDFANHVGAIIADLKAASDQAGNLVAEEIRASTPIQRADAKEAATMGEYHKVFLRIRYHGLG